MRHFGSLIFAVVTFLAAADAFACSCASGCDDDIAVGISVPQNVKGVGVIPCADGFPTVEGDEPLPAPEGDEPLPAPDGDEPLPLEGEPEPSVKLLRKKGNKWEKVEHQVSNHGHGVMLIGPKKAWKAGQDWRLTVGKTTREFSIKKPLRTGDVTIKVNVTDPVVEEVSYPAGVSCSHEKTATRHDVSLEFPADVAPYRHLFVVTQKANGVEYQHNTSLCSTTKPTQIYRDQTYLVPLQCPEPPQDGGETPEPVSVAITYEAAIPGLDVPVGVASPEPFTPICDESIEGEEAAAVDPVEPEEPPVAEDIAHDAPTPDAPTPAPGSEPSPTTVEASEASETSDNERSWPMVIVGLGLFLVLSVIIGWKLSTDS